MLGWNRKTPLEKEWESLYKTETKFLEKRKEQKDSTWNKMLEEKIPAKLQETLNQAFYKAFHLIFEKGTGVIEKTYRKDELEKSYKIHQYADEIRQTKKSLKKFSKKAKTSSNTNILLSGTAGVGMGILGIGIPDIPIFTGMILKNIYEIALNYGFEYESEDEQYFILLLIQGAVSKGELLESIDNTLEYYIYNCSWPCNRNKEEQIKCTSDALSQELLYMKFLQGIPLVGAVGGIYDAVYMGKISEYATLKYKKRFLYFKKK